MDDTNIAEVLRNLVKQTMDAASPTRVFFGTVTRTSPLEINVEQRFTIPEQFIILTKNVRDYETEATVSWNTEATEMNANHSHDASINVSVTSKATVSPNPDNISVSVSSDASEDINVQQKDIDLSHNHSIVGRKKITIHNALKNGDRVILIQAQGGQKYIVLDKVV